MNAGIDESFKPTKCKEIIACSQDDGTISVLPEYSEFDFYSIDGIAAQFWLEIDGSKSIKDIIAVLLEKNAGVSRTRLTKDSLNLVKKLIKAKLIIPN